MSACLSAGRGRALLAPLGAFCLALLWALWPLRAHADLLGVPCHTANLISTIAYVNSTAEADTIVLSTDCTYALTAIDNTIPGVGSQGLPVITSPLTIVGQGAEIMRDVGAPELRLFFVDHTTLTLQQVTLGRGLISGSGAAGAGGAILLNAGVLNIEESTLANNTAVMGGALAGTVGAQATVTGSTWRNNTATGVGGGGAIYGGTTLNVSNSTFSGNQADAGGGALTVVSNETAALDHVTIVGNSSGSSSGAVYSDGAITLTNSIVAGALAGANCDFGGGTQTRSYNLTDDASCGSGFTQVAPTALHIGPLQDNGGPTFTHALLGGSPAINAANPVDTGGNYDQRGDPNLRVRDENADIGAFEANAAKVGGAVTGLAGSGLVLALNGVYTLPVAADGPFTFAPFLVKGDTFAVTVLSQPQNHTQLCSVTNGAGGITGVEVTNVAVTCVLDQRTLTVGRSGGGGGIVTSTPAGIDCGATCQAPIDRDSVVTLTATAAISSTFAGWAGDCTGATCVLTMDAARSVTATFALKQFEVTLPSPSARGMVQLIGLEAAGAAAPDAPAMLVAYGSVLQLSAVPNPGYVFTAWGGDLTGAQNPLTVTITGPLTVAAQFDFALHVYMPYVQGAAGGRTGE